MKPAWLPAENEEVYPFVRLLEAVESRKAKGLDVYDFSTGDPIEPTPEPIRRALMESVETVCRYPTVKGDTSTREAIVAWIGRRFGVPVDANTEVFPTSGSKEAIYHAPLAFFAKGCERRGVLYPTPGYPVYRPSAVAASAEPIPYRLDESTGFLPDPDRFSVDLLQQSLLFWINSPHNPTGAVAERKLLGEWVALAREHGLLLLSDECYVDMWFDTPPASVLECGLESVLSFHSLSKRSGMTGYRSGFVAGDARAISVYLSHRPKMGTASPRFVQAAARAAWSDQTHVDERRALFAAKRQLFLDFFRQIGIEIAASEATFYIWARVPRRESEESYTRRLLDSGLVISPGSTFGPGGEGWFRVALVPSLDDCRRALEVWRKLAEANVASGRA